MMGLKCHQSVKQVGHHYGGPASQSRVVRSTNRYQTASAALSTRIAVQTVRLNRYSGAAMIEAGNIGENRDRSDGASAFATGGTQSIRMVRISPAIPDSRSASLASPVRHPPGLPGAGWHIVGGCQGGACGVNHFDKIDRKINGLQSFDWTKPDCQSNAAPGSMDWWRTPMMAIPSETIL